MTDATYVVLPVKDLKKYDCESYEKIKTRNVNEVYVNEYGDIYLNRNDIHDDSKIVISSDVLKNTFAEIANSNQYEVFFTSYWFDNYMSDDEYDLYF